MPTNDGEKHDDAMLTGEIEVVGSSDSEEMVSVLSISHTLNIPPAPPASYHRPPSDFSPDAITAQFSQCGSRPDPRPSSPWLLGSPGDQFVYVISEPSAHSQFSDLNPGAGSVPDLRRSPTMPPSSSWAYSCTLIPRGRFFRSDLQPSMPYKSEINLFSFLEWIVGR